MKMKVSIPLAVSRVSLMLTMLAFARSSLAQTDLRWRLAPEERLELVLSESASTQVEIAGQTYKSSLQVKAALTWRVIEIDEHGAATIEQTLTQLTVAAELPGVEPVRYDSSSQERLTGAAKAVAEEFRPLLG